LARVLLRLLNSYSTALWSEMTSPTWIAFGRTKRIALGTPREVATVVKAFSDANPNVPVVIFDAKTSQTSELDLRGSISAVLRRVPNATRNSPPDEVSPNSTPTRDGPGRPKLGVVAREVTLLPRHWNWLATQPGGASNALRKLVEQAHRSSKESDQAREAKESAYRFMHAMAGDEPGFEEASRALFAGDMATLRTHIRKWPKDIREHAIALVGPVLQQRPVTVVTGAP
jgi:hypothetical protein